MYVKYFDFGHFSVMASSVNELKNPNSLVVPPENPPVCSFVCFFALRNQGHAPRQPSQGISIRSV